MTAPPHTSTLPVEQAERGPRRPATLITLSVITLLFFFGFSALGTWQVFRRTWKLDLIAKVDQRVHATASAAPGPDRWPQISAAADEYRHVSVSGHYLDDRQTLVQASTDLGSGFWLLTPLQEADGTTVLINRGFVSPGWHASHTTGASVSVSGLLRISEPGGGFLRKNDPSGNRWFSRDVTAIAAARGLSRVAPYFIDAEAAPTGSNLPTPAEPIGGLTVIAFHNSHLVYAITWYLLALMVALGAWRVGLEEKHLRQRRTEGSTNVL